MNAVAYSNDARESIIFVCNRCGNEFIELEYESDDEAHEAAATCCPSVEEKTRWVCTNCGGQFQDEGDAHACCPDEFHCIECGEIYECGRYNDAEEKAEACCTVTEEDDETRRSREIADAAIAEAKRIAAEKVAALVATPEYQKELLLNELGL